MATIQPPPVVAAAAASAPPSAIDDLLPSAVPTLKVMRLQAPQLGQAPSTLLSSEGTLSSNLMLPDSFGVIHVGETFAAYLGVLNAAADVSVRGLTVSAQLQTPSRRIVLPSRLDGTPADIEPSGGVDAIVSRRLEEVGPHILRVEVGYVSNGQKSLRKFYRFNVTNPLSITESVVRGGDAKCFVTIRVQNTMEKSTQGAVTISDVRFQPSTGLASEQITLSEEGQCSVSALDLYDSCGRLQAGESYQYLFSVRAESETANLRGISYGDDLGQAVITYHKAMGETGVIKSSLIVCPPTALDDEREDSAATDFVVHGSGLSVDVAAAAAQRSLVGRGGRGDQQSLDERLPVTVEPISPPSTMNMGSPQTVSLLVVNHSSQPMNVQLQMRLSEQSGVVVCGQSYLSVGEVGASGGSTTVDIRLIALVAGLFKVQGVYCVDLTTGKELKQPSLFQVFVQGNDSELEEEKQ